VPSSLSGVLACISLLFLRGLFLPAAASAAEILRYEVTDLKVDGVVTGVIPGDLNGDGRCDVLVLHTAGDIQRPEHYISVFFQWEDRSFSTAADQSWKADGLAQAVALEAVPPNEPSNILYLRRDGVFRHVFSGGRFDQEGEILIEHGTLFVSSESERLLPLESFSELDGEGNSRITLPGVGWIIRYLRTAAGHYEAVDSVYYRLKSRMLHRLDEFQSDGTLSVRQILSIPHVATGSLRPDRERDLILLYSGKMEGFFRGENGFSADPDLTIEYDLAAKTPGEAGSALVQPALYDINGDGYADVVVTKQVGEGLSGFKTTLDIYFGPLAYGKGKGPVQRLVFEDTISYAILFEDLDGDGFLEMAIPTIKVGVFDLIRILTTQTLKVRIDIYHLGEDGLYSEEPRYIHEIKADLDFGGGGTGEVVGELINANGDDLKDLVVSLKPDRLSVVLGKGGSGPRFFERDPAVELQTIRGVEIETADLTGNGLDDLIATFGTSSEGVGLIKLYLNRAGARPASE